MSLRCVDEKEVKRLNEQAPDWTATCPVCGVELVGTIAELKKHKHGK